MAESSPAVRAQNATLDLDDSTATPYQRCGSVIVCALLVLAAAIAFIAGHGPGPEIKPLIPIAATIWSLADLLTAFLLVAQFYVNGSLVFGILASAYTLTGLLTWPYVAAFPGLFTTHALTLGDQQISVTLWTIWHLSFPTLVIVAALNDSPVRRMLSRRTIAWFALGAVAGPFVAVVLVSIATFVFREHLPHFVIHGVFQPVYRIVCVPIVIVLNVIACAVLIGRRKRLTSLSLWLSVATFATGLDAALNLSASRYSFAWDTGKVITVLTASVVLLMILADIFGLYGRMARVARIDVLTSLFNRRAFDEHYALVFHNARRLHGSVGLLVMDIDLFKNFNDTYGHAGGDECLRRVARELCACATRPLDFVARYGGEEFVMVLPDTPLHGVMHIAERIRDVVERLEIVYGNKSCGNVTLSIGIGYVPDARGAEEAVLFDAADRALYDAKARGRNRIMLGTTALTRSEEPRAPTSLDAVPAHRG
jgi:diguanylate cyclase (GGDEF)-like protein